MSRHVNRHHCRDIAAAAPKNSERIPYKYLPVNEGGSKARQKGGIPDSTEFFVSLESKPPGGSASNRVCSQSESEGESVVKQWSVILLGGSFFFFQSQGVQPGP